MRISHFGPDHEDAVISLWDRCGLLRSWNDPTLDIRRKKADRNGCFLVGHVDQWLVASIMVGYDGHRGTINYLAIDPRFSGQGFGKTLMLAAEEFLKSIGCPKVQLCVRLDNEAAVEFYSGLGYEIQPVHFFGKRLISDE